MNFALLIFGLTSWTIHAFFGTEQVCEDFIHEINEQRVAAGQSRHLYTCLDIVPEPIFYSK